MNPIAFALAAVAAVLALCVPRRFALVPFFLVAPLLGPGPGQAVMIGPFSFYLIRLLLVALWVRILLRGEYRGLKHSNLDTLIVLYFLCGTLAYVTLRGWAAAALVNRLGWAFDGVGIYFLVRWLVRDRETWVRVVTCLGIVSCVIAPAMVLEHQTGNNLFSLLGSVEKISEVRDDLVRSQGPFLHPILAGAFGASLAALLASLTWLSRRNFGLRVVPLISSIIIVATSASSTPIVACAASLGALAAWPIRKQMRLVRWCIVLLLIVLQLAMNNPIWALPAKLKVFGGSTGWYRYYLLDNFITRFFEWCLLGVTSTAAWGRGLWDVTIMYVRVGVDGGAATFLLFLIIIVQCYKKVGRAARSLPDTAARKCAWALGAGLTCHVLIFFGVNYWDQNTVSWYTLLAVIAGCGDIFAKRRGAELKKSTSPEHDAIPCHAAAPNPGTEITASEVGRPA